MVVPRVGGLDAGLIVGRELAQPVPGVVPVVFREETLESDMRWVDAGFQQQALADGGVIRDRSLVEVADRVPVWMRLTGVNDVRRVARDQREVKSEWLRVA